MKTHYAIVAFLLLAIPAGHASTGSLNFSVSPSIIELKVKPNSTRSITLAILNNDSQDLTLSVSIQDLTTNQNGSTNIAPANSSPFSCTSWITPETNKFTVTAGSKTPFTADLSIPSEVTGGRYAVILFEPVDSEKEDAVQISGRIGVLVMLSIAGRTELSGQIVDFHSSSKTEGVFFQGQIKNTGNIHYKCHADIVIISSKQRIVDRLNVKWASQTILPNATRDIDVAWNNTRKMQPGKYDIKLRFFIHGGGKSLQKTIPLQIK